MSRRVVVASFDQESRVLEATSEARRLRYPIVDVHTPYPVHGIDEAMGLKPSRLGIACFLFGLAGAVLAMAAQYWVHAVDWPLNVGGRPFNAWPAYVPVAFEVMVLLSGIGTVLALFWVSRLYPGKPAVVPGQGALDDRFVLVIEATGAASDVPAVLGFLKSRGALSAAEEELSAPPRAPGRVPVAAVLGGALVLVVLACWVLRRDPGVPNLEFLPDMAHPVSYPSFSEHPDLPGGMTMQPPQEGTIARGQLDWLAGGAGMNNPFRRDDAGRLLRGSQVYVQTCLVCHGPEGKGDGLVTQRGVPPPPSLLGERAMGMTQGEIFQVITRGQGNMAAYGSRLSPEDRWAAVLHVLELQGRGEAP